MIQENLHVSTKKKSACFELSFVAKNVLRYKILLIKNHCTPNRKINDPLQGENFDF